MVHSSKISFECYSNSSMTEWYHVPTSGLMLQQHNTVWLNINILFLSSNEYTLFVYLSKSVSSNMGGSPILLTSTDQTQSAMVSCQFVQGIPKAPHFSSAITSFFMICWWQYSLRQHTNFTSYASRAESVLVNSRYDHLNLSIIRTLDVFMSQCITCNTSTRK